MVDQNTGDGTHIIFEGDGTWYIGTAGPQRSEVGIERREKWSKLIGEFGQFINRLQHRGGLAIMIYATEVLPLRERMESGERTEMLYESMTHVMKELDNDESAGPQKT